MGDRRHTDRRDGKKLLKKKVNWNCVWIVLVNFGSFWRRVKRNSTWQHSGRVCQINFKKEEKEQQKKKGEGYISTSSLTNSHEHSRMWGQRAPALVVTRHSCVCVLCACKCVCEWVWERKTELIHRNNALQKRKYLQSRSTGNLRVLLLLFFPYKVEALPESSSQLDRAEQNGIALLILSHYCSGVLIYWCLLHIGSLKTNGFMVRPGALGETVDPTSSSLIFFLALSWPALFLLTVHS